MPAHFHPGTIMQTQPNAGLPSDSPSPAHRADELTRRRLMQLAVAGAVAGSLQTPAISRAAQKLPELSPGIKISLQVPTNPGDDDFPFARQLGVEYLSVPSGGTASTLDNFRKWKTSAEQVGLKVWN